MGAGAERYERIREIASGGMATVYLGRAVGAGGFERRVAIKVMHSRLMAEPQFVAMFLDEARLAARIVHPNVISTIDVHAATDEVFLVMDYVEGLTLHGLVRRLRKSQARVPVPVVARILVDVLAGLHAAHELTGADGAPLQLVHRDVSPQNVIVGLDGTTRLTDFGIARAEARLAAATQSGQLKGKLGYMSPEQLRAKPVDRRSDVYSAGVVLWELLVGARLFKGDNDATVALSAAAGPQQSPRQLVPEVPEAVDEVVMRALARAPEDRYPTAAAFSDALEDAVAAAGVQVARTRDVRDYLAALDDEHTTQIRSGRVKYQRKPVATAAAYTPPTLMGHHFEMPTTTTEEMPTALLDRSPKSAPSEAPPSDEGDAPDRYNTSTAGGASITAAPVREKADPRMRVVAALAVALIGATVVVYSTRKGADGASEPSSAGVERSPTAPPGGASGEGPAGATPAPLPPTAAPAAVPPRDADAVAPAVTAAATAQPATTAAPRSKDGAKPKTPKAPRGGGGSAPKPPPSPTVYRPTTI